MKQLEKKSLRPRFSLVKIEEKVEEEEVKDNQDQHLIHNLNLNFNTSDSEESRSPTVLIKPSTITSR